MLEVKKIYFDELILVREKKINLQKFKKPNKIVTYLYRYFITTRYIYLKFCKKNFLIQEILKYRILYSLTYSIHAHYVSLLSS